MKDKIVRNREREKRIIRRTEQNRTRQDRQSLFSHRVGEKAGTAATILIINLALNSSPKKRNEAKAF